MLAVYRSNVSVSNSVGEVPLKDSSTELIDLDLPDHTHPGTFQPQIHAPDS